MAIGWIPCAASLLSILSLLPLRVRMPAPINLHKARQIECTYAYCLENNVEQGTPSFSCTSVRSSSWCKYVYGEIFRVISPLAMADYMLSRIRLAVSDPLGLVSAVAGV